MVQELVAVTPPGLSSSGCTASLHNIGGREQGYCTSVFPNTGTQTLPAMFSAVPNGHKLYSQGSVKCVPLAKVIQLFKSVASVLLSASTHKAFTREPVVALFGKISLFLQNWFSSPCRAWKQKTVACVFYETQKQGRRPKFNSTA